MLDSYIRLGRESLRQDTWFVDVYMDYHSGLPILPMLHTSTYVSWGCRLRTGNGRCAYRHDLARSHAMNE